MTKFTDKKFQTGANSAAYRDSFDRIFKGETTKLCTCVDQADIEKPCHCCGAQAGHACTHPKNSVDTAKP